MRSLLLATGILVLASTAALAQAPGETEPAFAGPPYSGTVEVELFGPDGRARMFYDWGDAEGTFAPGENGDYTLMIAAGIEEEGDASLTLAFAPDGAGGWIATDPDTEINLAADGTISGTQHGERHVMEVSGQLAPARIDLVTLIVLSEHPDNGISAGDTFAFEYTLSRRIAGEDGESDCARIGWRLQASPNLFGGAMDMVRVPYCISE